MAMRRERKVVAALFADLVGSTALTETLDPEDAMEVVGAAVAAMVLAVEELGGTVKDLAGDGVLALFGAPVAHEDDAERAIRAGLRIVEAVRSADERLDVRVGIDTGLVVLGPVGAGSRVEYGATGDTVNVAARLQSAAEPGTVLVGDSTRGLTRDRFSWGPRRELTLKGKAEPVGASTALAPVTGVGPLRRYDRPLVGRAVELAVLTDAVDRALAGEPGVVVVEGEGGVGKSRLLDEARAHGDRRRDFFHWITLRCQSYDQTVPFGPVRRLLEGWLGIGRDTSRDDAARIAAEGFGDLFDDGGTDVDAAVGLVLGLPGAANDESAFRVAGIVEVILRRLRRTAPVVVSVEDVQWADRATLELLDHLVDRADELGILLVLSGRPAPGHPLERWGLAGTRLVVGPLTADDAEAHLESMVGRGTLPIDLERSILATAEGNPYFVEELVRAMIDAGALVATEHGPTFDETAAFEVPPTLERVVLERLDRLPDDLRAITSAAAVAGRVFDAEVVADVVAGDEPEVAVALKELTRLGLVEPIAERWRFSHAVIQDAAYRALLRKDRRALHARVAEALERRMDPPDLGELARHWFRAEEPGRAVAPALAAGEAARRTAAYDEAVAQLGIAVAAATDTDSLSAAMLLELADAQRRAGQLSEALRTFQDAAGWAATKGDAHASADAAVGYEDTFFATRRPRSPGDPTVPMLRSALSGLGDEVSGRRVRALAALGRALTYGGERAEGRAVATEAIEVARATDDAGAAAYALLAWRVDALGPERLHDRLPLAEEAVAAADRAGDDELWIEAARARFVDLLASGARDEADALLVELRRRITAGGQPFHLWYLAMWEAQMAILDGDLDRADEQVEAFRRQGRRLRYADVDQVYVFQKLLLARERGGSGGEDVLALYERLAALDTSGTGRMPAMIAVVLAEVGDERAAAAFRALADDRFRQVPFDQARSAVLALLAEAAVLVGTAEDAGVLADLLAPWSGQAVVVGAGAACLGAADHYLGRLAQLRGDREAADRSFAAAAALHARLRAPLLLARTRAARTASGQ
jgi:class 3 adenylate cyclase